MVGGAHLILLAQKAITVTCHSDVNGCSLSAEKYSVVLQKVCEFTDVCLNIQMFCSLLISVRCQSMDLNSTVSLAK